MNLFRPISFLVLAFVAAHPHPAGAQPVRHPLAVDVTLGISTGHGGVYTAREALNLDLMVVPRHTGALLAAVAAGVDTRLGASDICLVTGPESPFRCAPEFPDLWHVGVLAGAEAHAWPFTARAMAGPALYGGGSAGAGALAHADAAVGGSHMAFVIAGDASAVARADRARFTILSWRFGARIQ